MREANVDLWEEPADAKCITTNGFVKVNGNLVMGAGTAGQAQSRFPKMPKMAGEYVKKFGNHVTFFGNWYLKGFTLPEAINDDPFYVVTFPVKHAWYEDADLELIERSAHELMELANRFSNWKKILLPRPGCGWGMRTWEEVKPVIEPILDDRIWVIDK